MFPFPSHRRSGVLSNSGSTRTVDLSQLVCCIEIFVIMPRKANFKLLTVKLGSLQHLDLTDVDMGEREDTVALLLNQLANQFRDAKSKIC